MGKVSAQDDVQIVAQQFGQGIWRLEGRGGNIILLDGPDTALMIDDQFAPLTEKILKTVDDLTGKEVAYVINTHWHGDHTGGNENMGEAGSVIVAHRNVRQRMSQENFNELWNSTTPPSPDGALPVITFTEEMSLYWGEHELRIVHVPNAHTDGDAMVHFTDLDVLHVGDTWFNGLWPYIDVWSGGSSKGVLGALDYILEVAGPTTRVVCGHGPMGTRQDIETYREFIIGIRTSVMELIKEGKSLEEIVELNPAAPYEDEFGGGFLSTAQFLTIFHKDLSEELSQQD